MLVKFFCVTLVSKDIVKRVIVILYKLCNTVYFELRLSYSNDRIWWTHTINLAIFNLFVKQRSLPHAHIDIHAQRWDMRLGSSTIYSIFTHQHLKLSIDISIPWGFISFLNDFLFLSNHCHFLSSFLSLFFNLFNFLICWFDLPRCLSLLWRGFRIIWYKDTAYPDLSLDAYLKF